MSQDPFRRRHEAGWVRLERLLDDLEHSDAEGRARGFPEAYRRICQQLALARHRRYSADIVDRLNRLAARGYRHLYAAPVDLAERLGGLVAVRFPRAVRREWRLVALAALLFYGPGLAMVVGLKLDPALVHAVLAPEQLADIEGMYDPESSHFLRPRESGGDLLMFGFYIRNNIGIAFRTFATGLALGTGSLFFLVFNGVMIGTVFGHLSNVGFGGTLYPFVIGHGSLELTGIVLSGAAGLRLGVTVLAPGRRSRMRALLEESRAVMDIVYGFALMLLGAAFVEAFWSSQHELGGTVRYVVGAAGWLVVAAWLGLAGREPRAA